jgi:hypothetical protein
MPLVHFAQNTYALTPNGQIWPRALNTYIGGSSSYIYLIVSSIGAPSGEGLDFINGYTFLERFYSVFDTTNSQVGFATTEYTTATTNWYNFFVGYWVFLCHNVTYLTSYLLEAFLVWLES